MKPLKAIATFVLIAILAMAAFFIKSSTDNSSFLPEDGNKEHVLYKEGSTEKLGFEEHAESTVNDGHQGASSVFSYNFLFNLIYKFAYGQLQR
jgi:hypothetical protein